MDGLAIPIVSIITVFLYLAVESWADARRREQDVYYNSVAFLISALTAHCQKLEDRLTKNATGTSGRQSH